MPDDISSLSIRIQSEGVRTATGELKILITVANQAERATDDLGTTAQKSSNVLGGLKAGLAAVGVSAGALAYAVGKTTREWLAYDKAMREVASISTGTKKEMVALRADVLKLASAVGVDATVAAKGLYQALSAGVPKDNAFGFLETASKTAVAGVTSVDVAVDGLTNVINAWKLDVKDAESVADQLFMAVVDGKTTFEELASNMSKASVPAAALGVGLKDVLSWLVATTSQGTPTAEAFTQLKATITALQDPSEQLLAVYDKLGVSSGRQAIAQFGLQKTLEAVTDTYKGNDAMLVKALRSSEAFNGVLSVTGENAEKTRSSYDRLGSAAGSMGRAYAENAGTLEGALNSVKASAIGLVEQMENSFGIIKAFTGLLRDAALAITAVSSSQATMTTNALNAAKSLGGTAGAMEVQKTITELNALIAKHEETKAAFESKGVKPASGGWLAEMTGFDSAGSQQLSNATSEIARLKGEVGTLRAEYEKMPEATRKVGDSLLFMNSAKEEFDKGTITESQYIGYLDQAQKAIDNVAAATEKRAAAEKEAATAKASADKEAEARAQGAVKLAAEQEAAAKNEADAAQKAVDMAHDLAQTDRDRLDVKMNAIQAGIDAGRIDQETGAKAKAALEEEIRLLEERNAKKGLGPTNPPGGGGGSASSSVPKGYGSLASEYALPDLHKSSLTKDANMIEQLADEERKLNESYERRRQAIVDSEKLTGEQKIEALRTTEQQYQDELKKFEVANNKAYLGYASQFFGDLATIAGAFGKKGAKVAKGFAIAQATIKTYESATSAYSSLVGVPYIGPYIAPVAAAAAVASGLANIAKIRSTEYSGEYALGGNIPAGKYGLVGEAGPERVRGPAFVSSAHATRDQARAVGSDAPPVFHVHNYAGVDVSQETRQSPTGSKEYHTILRKIKKDLAQSVATGGDEFADAFPKAFGVRRGTS